MIIFTFKCKAMVSNRRTTLIKLKQQQHLMNKMNKESADNNDNNNKKKCSRLTQTHLKCEFHFHLFKLVCVRIWNEIKKKNTCEPTKFRIPKQICCNNNELTRNQRDRTYIRTYGACVMPREYPIPCTHIHIHTNQSVSQMMHV